jgi:hypothetical protein
VKSRKLVIAILFTIGAPVYLAALPNPVAGSQTITDAQTTSLNRLVDDLFNGFGAKGTPIDECVEDPVPDHSFEDNKFIFNEIETVEDGIGPVYNALGCGDCHNNPLVGGLSQVRELRAGHLINGSFVNPPGNQNQWLIQLRAIDARRAVAHYQRCDPAPRGDRRHVRKKQLQPVGPRPKGGPHGVFEFAIKT